ncbi:MAG: hypothetical protein ACRD07_17930 [Acidimicrobiales bacterium]
MTSTLRRLLRDYVGRRSPWGPPWWVYGVVFGTANLIRQVVIIVAPGEVSAPVRVTSWVATVVLVIGAINGVAAVLRRRARPHQRARPSVRPSDAAGRRVPAAAPATADPAEHRPGTPVRI